MEYEYLLTTDITDCYGSIYTHSISWALHGKSYAKTHRKNTSLIGNIIDTHIRDMSYGQTNGIPQGSVVMDFIAEMILGYADIELSNKLNDARINDYQILRYRDDYRIFINNPQDAEQIMKFLSEILIGLGLKINVHKTLASNDVIRQAIKPDNLYWMTARKGARSLKKHLLILYDLSQKYPNSGALDTELDKFFQRIEKKKKKKRKKKKEIKEDLGVLASIVIEIVYKNPRTYPVISAILSEILSAMQETNRNELLKSINKKFKKIPNTEYLHLWLQRITLKFGVENEYSGTLCQKVIDRTIKIWNSDWLTEDMQNIINDTPIINDAEIEKMSPTMDRKEYQIFNYHTSW
jgi:predicted transcriptional regulator